MALEGVLRRNTVADGYAASEKLAASLSGFLLFYLLQTMLLMASILLITDGGLPALGIDSVAHGIAAVIALGLMAFYGLLILLLKIAAARNLRWLCALTSAISSLLHLSLALSLAVLVGFMGYSVLILGQSYPFPAVFPVDSEDPTAVALGAIAIFALGEAIFWVILLLATISRSLRSFLSTFAKVPGICEFTDGTRVFSSTRIPAEMEFLQRILTRIKGYSPGETEEMVDDAEGHLIRFASRNGELVAASLLERPSYSPIAIFTGRDDPASNVAALLEDSYLIQRRRRRGEAKASMSYDYLVAEIAEKNGWTVEIKDPLMELRRS